MLEGKEPADVLASALARITNTVHLVERSPLTGELGRRVLKLTLQDPIRSTNLLEALPLSSPHLHSFSLFAPIIKDIRSVRLACVFAPDKRSVVFEL